MTIGNWSNYFLATGGAAAALAGLIFVGVSLNLKQILSVNHLPGRALGSLILLINILLVSTFCLIPGQTLSQLGGDILIPVLITYTITLRNDIVMYRVLEQQYRGYFFQNLIATQVAMLPYFVACALLLAKSTEGFYWLVAAVTCSFVKSMLDAWVLLVEINR